MSQSERMRGPTRGAAEPAIEVLATDYELDRRLEINSVHPVKD